MLAIGFGLALVAYGHIVYAAALISGKNVSYRQVWSFTTWPPQSKGIACGKTPNPNKNTGTIQTTTTTATKTTAKQATGTTQAAGTTTAAGRG